MIITHILLVEKFYLNPFGKVIPENFLDIFVYLLYCIYGNEVYYRTAFAKAACSFLFLFSQYRKGISFCIFTDILDKYTSFDLIRILVYLNFSETIKKDESNGFRRFRPFNVFHPKYFPISLYTVHRCTM